MLQYRHCGNPSLKNLCRADAIRWHLTRIGKVVSKITFRGITVTFVCMTPVLIFVAIIWNVLVGISAYIGTTLPEPGHYQEHTSKIPSSDTLNH